MTKSSIGRSFYLLAPKKQAVDAAKNQKTSSCNETITACTNGFACLSHSLPRHQVFVKMPDGMPIVKVKLQYQNLAQISEDFALDKDKDQRMNERLLNKKNEEFTELERSQDEEDLDGNFGLFQRTKE